MIGRHEFHSRNRNNRRGIAVGQAISRGGQELIGKTVELVVGAKVRSHRVVAVVRTQHFIAHQELHIGNFHPANEVVIAARIVGAGVVLLLLGQFRPIDELARRT